MSDASTGAKVGQVSGNRTVSLRAFESFLRKAGKLVGVAVEDIARLAIPLASLIGAVTANPGPGEMAFLNSVELISNMVITIEQKWAAMGSAADAQKLADVLLMVEEPVIVFFEQAGIAVDAAYVLDLVNGVVALLRAQPGDALDALAKQ